MTAKFWVGGTGTWDNSTTTHWSLSTGGAGGAAVPGVGDTITFDASSGGGTVTVDTTINGLTFNTITMGAFTGTLDFSVNNPSITLGGNGVGGFSITGTGVRTLKLGSGTFTLKTTSNNAFDATTTTNLTFDTTSTATFNFVTNGAGIGTQDLIPGGLTFPNITYNVTTRSDGSMPQIKASTTFLAITFSGTSGGGLLINAGSTVTVTNAISWNGTSTGLLNIIASGFPTNGTKGTLAVAAGSTISWANIGDIVFTGTTVTATNSFNSGNNSGVTITGPSAGGGSHMIGG